MKELPYVGYKIKGFNYFIWFERKDQTIVDGVLIANNGWG